MGGWAALGQAGMEIGTAIWNAREAEKNRNWQERMSNTQYQRAADDMEKAGLNRILAIGSGASTPSGAQSAMAPSTAVSAGTMASSAKQQIAQSKAEENLIRQREQESKATEQVALANVLTASTQAELNQANTQLSKETSRLRGSEATKSERTEPIHAIVGDVAKTLADKARSTAKEVPDMIKLMENSGNSAKHTIEEPSWYSRFKDWAKSKRNPNVKSRWRY